MKQLISALFLTCCFLTSSSFALNLQDVYLLALQNDAELKIAESQYMAVVATLPLASSAQKPQINFNAVAGIARSDVSTTGSNDSDSIGYTLNLNQNLYNRQLSAITDTAEANTRKALADLESTRQTLFIRIANVYFDVLAAKDNVDFSQAEKNSISRQLEQAQKRFEVGLIAITDVKEAQAKFDSSTAQLIAAENFLANTREALQVIIGEDLAEPITGLGDNLKLLIPEPADSEKWVSEALKSNQNLLAAEAALQASQEERKRSQAGSYYPTLDLNASYGNTSFDSDNLGNFDQTDTQISLVLNVPLYTGGRTNAEIRQAEANYQSARYSLILQKRLVAQQTRDAYLGVVSGISQVKALKQALISSNSALEATEAGFEVGTRTSVDVLDSLRETFRAQRDYASARYDYLTNTLILKQAAGILNESDFVQIDHWLIQ